MAIPAFLQITTLSAPSWAMSYLRYPKGTVPGDITTVAPSPNGGSSLVSRWSVVGKTPSYLLVRIEATTALDPVPATSVVARWKSEPRGITTKQITRPEEAVPEWEAGSVGSVIGVVYNQALLTGSSQLCARRTVTAVSSSYCVLTAAIEMGEGTPLPDSIILIDAASGARRFEVLLERDAYRIDPCQVSGCGALTTGL
jgi:hypothetical protein